jgi:hypothetical protein
MVEALVVSDPRRPFAELKALATKPSHPSPRQGIKRWGLHLFLTLCCTQSLAHAAPAWQAELTPPIPGTFPKLAPTVLDLTLSWNGMINSGTIRMEFAPADVKKPGLYTVRSSSSSIGPAAALFPYRSNFWSEIYPTNWRPRYFHSTEADKKESVTTTVSHFPRRVETRESSKLLKTGVVKTTDSTFAFAPVYDIFSAMLFVRSQKLDAGDTITQVVLPFNTPYLLRVKVVGREVLKGRNTIRLTVGMRKIDRKTLELKPYKKLKSDATLWLSDDADRIPVEFRAAAFIGEVRATLTGHRKP